MHDGQTMKVKLCTWISWWQYQDGLYKPCDPCGKVARFKSNSGAWYCAEHWDKFNEMVNLNEVICAICNCEFYNGECNCYHG